jgi:hypothetical protein
VPDEACVRYRLYIVGHPRPRVCWKRQLSVVVYQNYWLPIYRLVEKPVSLGGMPETLAPREVSSFDGKCRFLTTGESLPPVVLSATSGWMILSANRGVMPELLAPCWEMPAFKWRLHIGELLCIPTTLIKATHRSLSSSTGLLEPPAPCCGMPKLFAPIHRFAGATGPPWWYVRTVGSRGGDLYSQWWSVYHSWWVPAPLSSSRWLIPHLPEVVC